MKEPKCKRCGHEFLSHAGDISHPTTAPCWAGACTGDGCDCRDYEEEIK